MNGAPRASAPSWLPPESFRPPARPRGSIQDPAEYEAQGARVPVGRVGQHAELADLCSYLMSEYAGFINGECIAVDGGASLVEGGGGTVQYLHAWGHEQWEEFRTRAARTVASQSGKA